MIRVTIDGKEFTEKDIRCWENKRVYVSRKTLKKRLRKNIPVSDADELARFKAELSDNDILNAFRRELSFAGFCTGIVVRLSGKKRKFSITEIDVDFCNAETLRRMYDDMMVKYSPPIEAGASFNPPNLAKDFILRASVSEAMGFL